MKSISELLLVDRSFSLLNPSKSMESSAGLSLLWMMMLMLTELMLWTGFELSLSYAKIMLLLLSLLEEEGFWL